MEPELSPELIIQAAKSQRHAAILSEIADEETEGELDIEISAAFHWEMDVFSVWSGVDGQKRGSKGWSLKYRIPVIKDAGGRGQVIQLTW